jgi:hypothetical protein
LLTRRFGRLPRWAIQRLDTAAMEQLDAWLEGIFDARSLEELMVKGGDGEFEMNSPLQQRGEVNAYVLSTNRSDRSNCRPVDHYSPPNTSSMKAVNSGE